MKFTPTVRRRLYETGALVLAVLVVWGVITADEAAQYGATLDQVLGVVLLLLARFNVNDDTKDGQA